MAIAQTGSITADAFLDWISIQQERFELVNGHVIKMMTGARQSHSVVVANIIASLLPFAKKNGCRATASDTAVKTGPFSVRYPDVVIDCGAADPHAKSAVRPTLVVDVSSPGTLTVDLTDKLDEYQKHDDIQTIILIEPNVVSVRLYHRADKSAWLIEKFDRLDQLITLSDIGATLSLADIYDTLQPVIRAHLQVVEEPKAN